MIESAIQGGGVSVGERPHLTEHLRDGVLVAPLGADYVARPGAFYVEISGSAHRDVAEIFVNWLHLEAQRDGSMGSERPSPDGT